MKYPEITFQTFLKAIRHQWKILLVSVLVFSLVGVGAGFVFSEKLAAPSAGSAASLEDVSFDCILQSASYYEDCTNYLFLRQKNAVKYIEILANDSTVTEKQFMLLSDQLIRLQTYKNTVLSILYDEMSIKDILYIPEDYIDTEIARYERLAYSTRISLISSEAAVELLKTMDSPDVGTDGINKSYEDLLSSAAEYGSLKASLIKYESALSQLKEHRGEVISHSRQISQKIEKAKKELNQLQSDICKIANSIAVENNLILSVDTVKNETEITIAHTHSLSSSQEAFAILVIFSILTGICFGLYMALCKEAKRSSKKPEQGEALY